MFFRNILIKGNSTFKDLAIQKVKNYYHGDFQQEDIIEVAKKEELFEHVCVLYYHRTI